MVVVRTLLLVLLAGSLLYCLLVLVAARRYPAGQPRVKGLLYPVVGQFEI